MEGDIVRVTSAVAIGTCWTRSKGVKVSRVSESRSPLQQGGKRISSNLRANSSAGHPSSSSSGAFSVVGIANVAGLGSGETDCSSAKRLLTYFMRQSQADKRRFDPANRTADPDSQVNHCVKPYTYTAFLTVYYTILYSIIYTLSILLSLAPRPRSSLFENTRGVVYSIHRHGADDVEHLQHFATYGPELCVAVSRLL